MRLSKVSAHRARCGGWFAVILVCLASRGIAQPVFFEDDFTRPDGPPEGWTTAAGSAAIVGNALQIGPQAVEHWTWCDTRVPSNVGDFALESVVEFLQPGNNATVGRHGGLAFHASAQATRAGATAFQGYFVDWIDRVDDHGMRLIRVDAGGVNVPLQLGTPELVEPPEIWRVETDETNIRVYADEVLVIDLVDPTYRGGYFGVWAWSGDELISYDDFVVFADVPAVGADFTFSPDPGETGTDIFFDASASSGDIVSYVWDFGDGTMGTGVTAEHIYAFSDFYTVTLTVEDGAGNTDSSAQVVTVVDVLLDYFDDFERDDGPVDEWTVATGDWYLVDGLLGTGPTTTESFIWAGSPPARTRGNVTFSFLMEFLAPGSNGTVGRHAGFQFHCDRPTIRAGADEFKGYFVDWIDRATDRGVRLSRRDQGVFVTIASGQLDQATQDPPLEWRVEIDGPAIRVYGDEVLLIDVIDETYRGGFFGFWSWVGDQEIRADELLLTTESVTACFELTNVPLAGEEATFDAACSEALGERSLVSYAWDFGDGSSATGATASHVYAFADNYTVTLTAEDDLGVQHTATRVISVAEALIPFADCFEGEIGPVEGWTAFRGDWNVTEGETLSTLTAGLEHWVWAGSPPRYARGETFVAEFEIEFLFMPLDGVGRHGGAQFHCAQATARGGAGPFSGYVLDWIDRVDDHGFRLQRFDAGVPVGLVGGTPDGPAEPPAIWRIETDATNIRVYGDDELVIDVVDATYREGYYGHWMYSNGQDVVIDNVRIGSDVESLPDCGVAPGTRFVRGDSDSSGTINLADGIQILNFLFQGGPAPACLDAADTDNGGSLQLTDGVRIFNYLFTGGAAPADPSPRAPNYDPADCGLDSGATLGCATRSAKCS